MSFPWRVISLNAAATATFLALRSSEWSRLSLVGSFAGAWVVQLLAWGVWAALLYPKLFSPLIGLPEPTGNHWLMGQYRRIADEPTAAPAQDW
jgi:hypothetical protein